MTAEETSSLRTAIQDLLCGKAAHLPEEVIPYAWQFLRWESDVPLTDELRQAIIPMGEAAMDMLGVASGQFSLDGDVLTLLICHTAFPAKVHRQTVLWLAIHAFEEKLNLALEQEGTLMVGQEFQDVAEWADHLAPMVEKTIWWDDVSPIPSVTARKHRMKLQTVLKRRQYTALGGHISRTIHGEAQPGIVCFGFVPLLIESIWSQHPQIGMEQLLAGLNLQEMTRKPQEALMRWVESLKELLQASPATVDAAPIERAMAGILADCSLPYSQANLSHSLGLSPAYFCRLFREKAGMHFSSFLTRARMEKAQALLASPGEHPLQEVGEACGYPNKSYFCQVFKKYTGMTPGEFELVKKGAAVVE